MKIKNPRETFVMVADWLGEDLEIYYSAPPARCLSEIAVGVLVAYDSLKDLQMVNATNKFSSTENL